MKKNMKVFALAGIAAVAVVGGSFAYYYQSAGIDNPLDTGHYKHEVIEEYTPQEDVHAGAKIKKDVGFTNTGDYPVVLRVSMTEEWSNGVEMSTTDGDMNPAKFGVVGYDNGAELVGNNYYAEQPGDKNKGDIKKEIEAAKKELVEAGKDANSYQLTPDQVNGNGKTGEGNKKDDSVVAKLLDDSVKTDWFYKDGYWYYKKLLMPSDPSASAGSASAGSVAFLEKLQIATNIDLGSYINKNYYYAVSDKDVDDGKFVPNKENIADTDWLEYFINADGAITGYNNAENVQVNLVLPEGDKNTDGKIDAIDLAKSLGIDKKGTLFRKSESVLKEEGGVALSGYADSNYTLTINADFLQANADSVTDVWGDEIYGMLVDTSEKGEGSQSITAGKDGVLSNK